MAPATLHLLMSVSKSVVCITLGALVEQGVIATEALVTDHVPELDEPGMRGDREEPARTPGSCCRRPSTRSART
jgi:CubicO group peptidase (beta-lactamase class C family)